jgi:membrane associated rhomboid family serine protease
MFPRSRILVLVFFFLFIDVVEIPAVVFLGFWFLFQVAGGVGRAAQDASTGGIAFWAHVGGFVAGLLGVWLFRRPERERAEWWSDRDPGA